MDFGNVLFKGNINIYGRFKIIDVLKPPKDMWKKSKFRENVSLKVKIFILSGAALNA